MIGDLSNTIISTADDFEDDFDEKQTKFAPRDDPSRLSVNEKVFLSKIIIFGS